MCTFSSYSFHFCHLWHHEKGNFFSECDQSNWLFYVAYYLEIFSSLLYFQEPLHQLLSLTKLSDHILMLSKYFRSNYRCPGLWTLQRNTIITFTNMNFRLGPGLVKKDMKMNEWIKEYIFMSHQWQDLDRGRIINYLLFAYICNTGLWSTGTIWWL